MRWAGLGLRELGSGDQVSDPQGAEFRKAGVVLLGLGIVPGQAAVLDVQGDQLAQQGGALRLGRVGQEVLDGGAAAFLPGLFKAITDGIDSRTSKLLRPAAFLAPLPTSTTPKTARCAGDRRRPLGRHGGFPGRLERHH
jgi:hypothetical protein